jgi:uncharacterized protein YutE (UPF0331/DUF86 family)
MIKKILELLSMEIERQLKSAERSKDLKKQHNLLRLQKAVYVAIECDMAVELNR